MSGRMIVCHCHRITDRTIVSLAAEGAADAEEIAAACQAGTDCRSCLPAIWDLLEGPAAAYGSSDPRQVRSAVA